MNNKKTIIIGFVFSLILTFISFFAINKSSIINFSFDLVIFYSFFISFIMLHFIFKFKSLYNKMFDFRYLITAGIFILLIVGKYHGSSISIWNNYIDNNEVTINQGPIIGKPRPIRSDEWLVSTPTKLSQTSKIVNFKSINSLINAKNTKVSFYPRQIQKDLTIIVNPENLGYLFLPNENAFSFSWYFSYFALFLVSIELFMIISKKHKLYSTLGAFLITLSPIFLWWNGGNIQLFGELSLLIIYRFIKTKKVYKKIILSSLLGWSAAGYIICMYPAWQIVYGYFFLGFLVYMLIENKEYVKLKDTVYLVFPIIIVLLLILPLYIGSKDVFEIVSNTVYPGARESYGGSNWYLPFNYIYNWVLPYSDIIANQSEFSQYLSFFPIPLFMGIYCLIKNYKNKIKLDWFLLLSSVISIILFLWCFIPLPKIFSKITLMTMSTTFRAQAVLGYISIFMLIRLVSIYNNKINLKKIMFSIFISILLYIGVTFLANITLNSFSVFTVNNLIKIISAIIFLPLIILLIINNEKTNKLLFVGIMATLLVSSLPIHPIMKGLNVIYEKPFSKEIQKIAKKDPDSKFLTVNNWVLSNYVLANGVKTITSTNFYPNLKLWHKLDPIKKYEEVYNRYAHISVNLTDKNTSFELIQNDLIKINLLEKDLCLIEANYIVSNESLKESVYYNLTYSKNNMYIYKTTCNIN